MSPPPAPPRSEDPRVRSNSNQSDREPPVAARLQRAVMCARPKRPRKLPIASLRAQVAALECVADNLPHVLPDLDDVPASTSTATSTDGDEDDPITTADHDAQRMRLFLKRTVALARQAQEEIAKRTEYLRLLQRHCEGTANLHKLMRGVELDYWFWMCERWRDLALKYHEPISDSKCYAIMQETIQAIEKYKLPEGTKQNDAFGWSDSVRLDDDHSYVRFVARKTLWHVDVKQLVDLAWTIYSDGDLFKQHHLGGNCDLFLHVLQRISPDMMVVQCVEKYPALVQMTHSLYLIFRVETETEHMIACRSIESSRLQSLMKAEGLSSSRNFFWDTFEVAHRDARSECDAVRFTLAGSIGSDNPTYAKRASDEILIALVRSEIQVRDASVLTIEEDCGTARTASQSL